MNDHLEGYCDGIAGRIMQDRRCGEYREWRDYINGWWLGNDDRDRMLTVFKDEVQA